MYENPLSCLAKPDFEQGLDCVVNAINAPMWDILVWVLIGVGLFFTVASGFVQLRLFGHSVKTMLKSRKSGDGEAGISSFQAFVTGRQPCWCG